MFSVRGMEGYQSSLMVEKGEEESENKVCWARRAEGGNVDWSAARLERPGQGLERTCSLKA
jgi:hypothetical protein